MTAIFTRNSVAYRQDGTLVNTNLPRYEEGRRPAPTVLSTEWQDTFDVDQIATHYTSGGDAPATWAVSGGVLSATGATQATLLRNGLTIADGEIIANVDRATNGGLIARHIDNNNYYLLALSDNTATTTTNLRILSRVNGAFTTLAVSPVVWARGTAAQIRFRFNGALLEAWFDSVRVLAVTDTIFTSGGVGIRQSHAEATRFLDLKIDRATQQTIVSPTIVVEQDATNIVLAYPTGWTVLQGGAEANLVVTNQGVQVGAALDTVRLTNSGTFEAYYLGPLLALAPSTIFTLSFKARGTVAGGKFQAFVLSVNSMHIQTTFLPILTPAFQTFTRTFTTTADISGTQQYIRFDHDGNDAGFIEIAEVSLIQRPYRLTFARYGATRVAETLTIPSAGVFSRGAWSVEGAYTPQIPTNVGNVEKTLFAYEIDGNNWLRHRVGVNGEWNFAIMSGGVQRTIAGAAIDVLQGLAYQWQISGDGSVMRLCVNGAQIGTDMAYTEPVGTMPTNLFIGSNSNGLEQANGFIDDLRISNRARTLAEHQAVFNSGLPIPLDADTTALYRFNNDLTLAAATTFAMRSATPTRSAGAINTHVRVSTRSVTPTRSAGAINTPVGLSARFATPTRSAATVNVTVSIAARTATVTRLTSQIMTPTNIQIRAPSTTRMTADINTTIRLAMRSLTTTRAEATLNVLVRVSGRAQAQTRFSGIINVPVSIAGISRTNSRLSASVNTRIFVATRIATPTRLSASIRTPVSITARTATTTDLRGQLQTVIRLTLQSSTPTRLTLLMPVSKVKNPTYIIISGTLNRVIVTDSRTEAIIT